MGLLKLNENTKDSRFAGWWLPLIFIVVSVLVMALGEVGQEMLRYDRVWIGQGEAWRFLTGHFAHLSWSHLALNSAGLLLVWFLIGSNYDLRDWLTIFVVTLTVMNAAFWFLNPELYWYVGMSGMLHGLLAAGIVARAPKLDTESIILLLLLVAKISWEQISGPVPGSETTSGGPVVVDAHLYGALGGVLGALLARIRVKPQASI
jgi:rhomboid family GlyGly-CTERM serine protease